MAKDKDAVHDALELAMSKDLKTIKDSFCTHRLVVGQMLQIV